MLAKRLTLSLLAIGVISLVVTAASFALFTASTSNNSNTFTTGTVTLATPSTTLIDVTNIAPGDSGSATYSVKYTGSLAAHLGLDTTLTGTLTSCDGGGKFTVSITKGATSFSANGTNQWAGQFATDETATFDIAWILAKGAGNDCQNKSAALTMLVHAVQAKNNTEASGLPTSW